MNEALEAIDNQISKWVAELEELYLKKGGIDNAICELEQRINIMKESAKYLKETGI